MSPGSRPTSVPSGILIHPTIWPQYTNVTDRQDRYEGMLMIQHKAEKDTISWLNSEATNDYSTLKQVVRVIWHKTASVLVGWRKHRFSRIEQLAPMYLPIWAHWRHLSNMIEPVLPSAHPSPQSILAQLMAESPYTYNGLFFPPKLPLWWRYLDPI